MKVLFTTLIMMTSLVAFAAPEGEKEASQTPPPKTGKKSTDLSFDDLLVQGKYHFSDEAVVTVEQDKVLDGLLEVRKDFKDRIEQSRARH